uniref:Leishmanolysin-like peptidase n=1 Tax=Arcella intermedia TaxID=1963864 RepID=A0A6B2L0P8_9EUKA
MDQSYTTSSGTTTNQYTCQTSDVLTPAKISMLKNYVIPALLETINNLLQVISETGNLVLDSQYHSTYGMNCRSNLAIPSSLLSSGVPSSDYYLMVTARPIANPNVLANALPCSHRIQPGNRFSRPLAGSINFNPGAAALLYSPNKPFLFNQILKTALHEMTHALGFTNDLFSDYLTPDGGYYAAGVTTTANYKGETKYLINTPRVVSYAQTHYGCSSLTGMELEDQGSNGAPGSHWESRLVDSEYMAGVSSPDSQVSALTLNFFEDMGWYTSNFSMVEEFDYGRGEGCAWATQPCSSATWNRYWCQSNSAADKCNGHRTAVGRCNYAQYTAALPSQYQYFSDPAVGGSNNWPDYCPVYQGYSNTYCHDPDGLVGSTQYGQTYSNISRCWDFVSPASSGCYPTLCGVLPGNTDVTVQVLISGSWRTCPVGGGNLDVSTSSGTVTVLCPKVEFFCSAAGKVNFTFNSNNNIPIPNAPTAPGTRTIPGLPDLPFLPPLPQIFPPSWNFNLTTIGDPWTWTIGSIPFYIVVIGGCLLLFLILLCCCCKK